MNVPDSKKVQSAINAVGKNVQNMRAEMADIDAVIAKFTAANPSVAGTPLAGNVSTLNTALTNLRNVLNSAVFTGLIAAISTTHQGKALD